MILMDTLITQEKDRRCVAQISDIHIGAIDSLGVKTTYYKYIQGICELDYGTRMQISIFRCQWVKHLNSVSIDNYGLTLVDLKNVGYQNDPWVLANHVTLVFYVLDLETGKHVVVSRKQKIVGVENMEDNDEYINQFDEMPLFTNPINIKHIEKDFDKNLMSYMRKGGNVNFV
jgi:hypothetical protein